MTNEARMSEEKDASRLAKELRAEQELAAALSGL